MIHRALKLLRTYHHLTQVDLAQSLGISNSYLSEIERGEKAVNFDLINKYAQTFNMPASSILLFSEKVDECGKSKSKLRIGAADKILRILEWIDERESIKKIE